MRVRGGWRLGSRDALRNRLWIYENVSIELGGSVGGSG